MALRVYITDEGEVRKSRKLMVDGMNFAREILEEYDAAHETEAHGADIEMSAAEYWLWDERLWREQRILDKANELGERSLELIASEGMRYGRDIDARQAAQEALLGIA